ncbi:Petrobactin import ATP-binding protein YclP [Providencia alcalifaciens]|uniref:ABC transporter, ATP-binding protein n=1 Tax=Providencia alcalifaciens 205/92 TaxID=1256988 RepID=A0AAV3M2P1_9GAMM|nr:ATP-binding cassette domain-containing protein [Providencia alcalifaciens]EKT65378.1 iron ABC transporter ATP-binding protein [Providencia alcalifaciens Dmel2]EUD01835.1 ABC transporter, ATP-binding protein [Providencia alcalifaciens RIMD 1656011]EUD06537.1 ABC transporter, ATP-binding protein [Providencia alcalifaciens R90-1475]EUD09764.1 ABC transporter, ATP-binding protein [Providencia alcalifaciens 205/92]MBF0691495.1 ATP-binding cassette domain-containing protein [Providencia alcalifac
MIEIHQISKSYQDTKVLDNVTASIKNSGVTSIIGPNGAGKSTLLSIIGRLLSADHGYVKVNELDVSTTPSDKLATCLSVLRQENQFASRLTVEELVGFGRYPYTKGRLTLDDKKKIDESLAFLNLTEFRHRYLDELSGGQRQRAYVAMVLCQDTEYVLLDEPLNNLDMKHAVIMMKLLRRAADELGKTIILVIHDINFASVYSDYIVALRNGRLSYHGAPEEIMKSDILEEIFDTPLEVKELDGQRIALYY